MKEKQDAFGQAFYSFYKGEDSCNIIERDDGYVDVDDPSNYFLPYPDWPLCHQQAVQGARGRVLDIGCGAGKHALHLQEEGCDVLGIDISPLAVEICRLRGLKNARVMSITQVSFRLGVFDTILMMGNNFGLFGSQKRTRWLLRRFHRLTSEKARIIAQTLDPYQTTDPFHLAYHELNRRRGRMAGQLRLRVRFKKYVSPWLDYLFVSKKEMADLLEDTGWRVSRFIDSPGAAYIAIIEKHPS